MIPKSLPPPQQTYAHPAVSFLFHEPDQTTHCSAGMVMMTEKCVTPLHIHPQPMIIMCIILPGPSSDSGQWLLSAPFADG